jgi:hypothetical protein
LNVSSVSSGSVWWEEYLEKQRKLQQAASGATSSAVSAAAAAPASTGEFQIVPEEILAELQALEDDPEKLKAKAAELAIQVKSEAENVSGVHTGVFEELVSDLEAVAENGDLSIMEKKIARGAAGGKPMGGPSGMSGGTGASIKWIEALVENDDDEDDELSFAEALEEFLAELEESKEAAESAEPVADKNTAADLRTGLIDRLTDFYNRQEQYSLFSATA